MLERNSGGQGAGTDSVWRESGRVAKPRGSGARPARRPETRGAPCGERSPAKGSAPRRVAGVEVRPSGRRTWASAAGRRVPEHPVEEADRPRLDLGAVRVRSRSRTCASSPGRNPAIAEIRSSGRTRRRSVASFPRRGAVERQSARRRTFAKRRDGTAFRLRTHRQSNEANEEVKLARTDVTRRSTPRSAKAAARNFGHGKRNLSAVFPRTPAFLQATQLRSWARSSAPRCFREKARITSASFPIRKTRRGRRPEPYFAGNRRASESRVRRVFGKQRMDPRGRRAALRRAASRRASFGTEGALTGIADISILSLDTGGGGVIMPLCCS